MDYKQKYLKYKKKYLDFKNSIKLSGGTLLTKQIMDRRYDFNIDINIDADNVSFIVDDNGRLLQQDSQGAVELNNKISKLNDRISILTRKLDGKKIIIKYFQYTSRDSNDINQLNNIYDSFRDVVLYPERFYFKKNINDLYKLESLIFANYTNHMENNTCAFFEFKSSDGTPYILNSYHIKKFTYEIVDEDTQKRMTISDNKIRIYNKIRKDYELLGSIDDDDIKLAFTESLYILIQDYLQNNKGGSTEDRNRYANIQQIEKELAQQI